MHKKTLSFLFTFLFLASCGKSGGGSGSGGGKGAGDSVTASEITTDSPVPSAALNFDVNLKLDNFDGTQTDKIQQAADLIRKVVASEDFKNKILNHTVNGKKTFVDNGGLSNAEIYAKLIEGSEKLRPGVDNQMDLDLELYKENTSVVGYTKPNVIKVWMNTKFFGQNPAWKVTTNMMHEWLHKLGFGHAFQNTPTRKYSVPYAVGYLTADIAKTMI